MGVLVVASFLQQYITKSNTVTICGGACPLVEDKSCIYSSRSEIPSERFHASMSLSSLSNASSGRSFPWSTPNVLETLIQTLKKHSCETPCALNVSSYICFIERSFLASNTLLLYRFDDSQSKLTRTSEVIAMPRMI